MLELPFLTVELLFAALWLLIRSLIWMKQERVDWRREAILLLMYINLAVILRFTFFPMSRVNGTVPPLRFSLAFPFRVNVIPFARLLDYSSKRDLLLNVVGNICMFIPSGVLLPLLYKKLSRFWQVVGAGFLLSLCIEIMQLPFSERASDVDDLILNTAGVIIGYGIYVLVKRSLKIRQP